MTRKKTVRNAFPALRVFIFGLEVTEDVLKCTCNLSDDDRAPSTAEIVLANKNNKYTLTPAEIALLNPTIDVNLLRLTGFQQLAIRSVADAVVAATPLDASGNFDIEAGDEAAQEAEINGLWRAAENVATATTALDTLDAKISESISSFSSSAKNRVLAAKYDMRQRVGQKGIGETGTGAYTETAAPKRLASLNGLAHTYEFIANAPIFHSNDPVRIFLRDPFDPSAWFYGHTGFITDWTRGVTADNVNTLTLRCEDVLRDLRYSRLTSNPGVLDIERARVDGEDLVFRTFFNETFSGLTVPEIVYTIVFGPDEAGTIDRLPISEDDKHKFDNASPLTVTRRAAIGGGMIETAEGQELTAVRNKLGVGSFNVDRSIIFILGNSTETPEGEEDEASDISSTVALREVRIVGDDALGVYQAFVDHKVLPSDIDNLIANEAAAYPDVMRSVRDALIYDSSGAATPESVIDVIGHNPHLFPVDGGRLFMLLPSCLGDKVSRRAILRDFVQSVATQTDMKPRLTVLFDMLERIEFSFYASPKGDILCEMPLYDFEPRDWGDEAISEARAQSFVQTARTGATGTSGWSVGGPPPAPLSLSAGLQLSSSVLSAANTIGPVDVSTNITLTPNIDLFVNNPRRETFVKSIEQAAKIRRQISTVATGSALGPFGPRYKIQLKDTMDVQQTFSDERIKTRMECGWNLLPGYGKAANSRTMGLFAVVVLDALIPHFGVRSSRCDDKIVVNSEEAANVYCHLKLNQANAEALTSAIDIMPMLWLGPNRPIQVEEGEYIATLRSVTWTIDWEGHDMSSTIGLNYTRPWDGSVRRLETGDQIPRYAPIGGYASRPLNYSELLSFGRAERSSHPRDGVSAAGVLAGGLEQNLSTTERVLNQGSTEDASVTPVADREAATLVQEGTPEET